MSIKQRVGRVLLPRLPMSRRAFEVLRFEFNAAITSTVVRLSPRLRRIRAELAHRKHLRVNLGSGGTGQPGWINIDIGRRHADQTLPWDIRKGLPFADESVAMIRAEHVLEHIEFREELPRLLRDVYRVLEPGGIFRVIVPDGERWIQAYAGHDPAAWAALGMATLPDDMPTPMAMINHVFHQDGEHYFGYDYETLRYVLAKASFEIVRRMCYGVSRTPELALDQPHHAPYSLYVEAEKNRSAIARMPILSTVTPGRERYCPILANHLDRVWPGHPELYFSLPIGKTADYANVVHSQASTFTGTLLSGLEYLKSNLGATHVFVLLEDHAPLWPCKTALLDELLTVVEAEDLKCLVFTKYDWPWNSTDYKVDADGRLIGWKRIDIATFRGHRMARVPKEFFRYNQCQPAIWNLDYYIEVVREAVRRGIHDPWEFESYVMPQQPQHYISEYKWPSWSNGYLDRGKIDWRAIRLMKMPESRELRAQLLREHFPHVRLPPTLLYVLGECGYRSEQLKQLPQRIARRAGRTLWPRSAS